ncbi:MAG: hypothetical protein KDA81_04975 [Planctomycetaceae bacterium]|nr:hypothetical protein [Planctomycetaceae bacterium]
MSNFDDEEIPGTARQGSRLSRRQKVVDSIQPSILNDSLRPGDPQRQILPSQEHDVSQCIRRECLQTVNQQGPVVSASQAGFVVRTLNIHELVGTYRVREVLEGPAARLCCRKASRDHVETLRDLVHQSGLFVFHCEGTFPAKRA